MPGLTLETVAGEFAVSHLAPHAPVPDWAGTGAFSSVTRTTDELSIICPAAAVPAGVRCEAGWRLIRFAGPFDFTAVGILASVTEPLARAGLSLIAIGTFNTDYILLKAERLGEAVRALEAAGHSVSGP